MRLALTCHPDTPSAAVRSIEVDVQRQRGLLALHYTLGGNVGAVAWPVPAGGERTDELWKHTCFEAFVRAGDDPSYLELNFSPSGQWASYRFDGYRTGMRVADDIIAPPFEAFGIGERYDLRAAADLRGPDQHSPWRLALSAVIEETSGAKSYWALKHPPGKPDFHHADGFAAEL
jgi:hypothetical protein